MSQTEEGFVRARPIHYMLNIQAPAVLEAALATWRTCKADFADCFMLQTVMDASESPLATFDTTLARLEGCKQL